eukprot:TRINITY_DN3922_c0_g1_i1.p1 TRINITY_DN3922_c0_g1~~TRINITY_DN3922_c0_g1_i1.p1  ORF type:complete len:554 (+),score=114.04 TRINITY_DN3922_c0_g1_i1:90-1751(+)
MKTNTVALTTAMAKTTTTTTKLLWTSCALNFVLLLVIIKKAGGLKRLMGSVVSGTLRLVPGASALLEAEMSKEVEKNLAEAFPVLKEQREDGTEVVLEPIRAIPTNGLSREDLQRRMRCLKERDVRPQDGQCWAYTYLTLLKDHEELVTEAHNLFMHENALNPMAFPSLRSFETEIVSMTKTMLHGDAHSVGTLTSGGTESLLLAIKAYRDYAREVRPHITEPEMIMPTTAHVALEKAGHYFGVKIVHVPPRKDLRADVEAMRRAINKNTILLVCSAPQYPHGVIDPVEDLSRVALEHNLPLHVDSCIGGFLLPWAEKLGYPIPKFDFRVKGVTSISADLHKYGYAPKGASCLVFRDSQLRRHQFFVYTQWPGGLYGSPSLLGTRGGGSIAGAWASLVNLGEKGFMELAEVIMKTSKKLQSGINAIEGLRVLSTPDGSLISFESTQPSSVNVFAVADVMEKKYGWHMERQPNPDSVHLTVMPPHASVADRFLSQLSESVVIVRNDPNKSREGSAAMYGLVAKIPDPSIADKFIGLWLDKVYQLSPSSSSSSSK